MAFERRRKDFLFSPLRKPRLPFSCRRSAARLLPNSTVNATRIALLCDHGAGFPLATQTQHPYRPCHWRRANGSRAMGGLSGFTAHSFRSIWGPDKEKPFHNSAFRYTVVRRRKYNGGRADLHLLPTRDLLPAKCVLDDTCAPPPRAHAAIASIVQPAVPCIETSSLLSFPVTTRNRLLSTPLLPTS